MEALGAHFEIPGRSQSTERYGSGHIHDTYLLRYDEAGTERRYIAQRVNDRVFRDPVALMENVARICDHQHRRRVERGEAPDRRGLQLVLARGGDTSWVDPDGVHWRCFRFVERTRSFDVVSDERQAHEAARAFADFIDELRDLEGPPLQETIAHFHDLEHRHAAFEAALTDDAHGRATGIGPEVETIRACYADIAARLAEAGADALPRRIVHNDCKINNVLFDADSGEALCVIDLDTVMPGTVLCDFGELVRTSSCRSPEDETDLEAMCVDPALLRALTRGFVSGAQAFLTDTETGALPLAGPRMALENALRFATDHLCGDVYFRILRPDHNRDRFRSQLRLAQLLTDRIAETAALVDPVSRG